MIKHKRHAPVEAMGIKSLPDKVVDHQTTDRAESQLGRLQASRSSRSSRYETVIHQGKGHPRSSSISSWASRSSLEHSPESSTSSSNQSTTSQKSYEDHDYVGWHRPPSGHRRLAHHNTQATTVYNHSKVCYEPNEPTPTYSSGCGRSGEDRVYKRSSWLRSKSSSIRTTTRNNYRESQVQSAGPNKEDDFLSVTTEEKMEKAGTAESIRVEATKLNYVSASQDCADSTLLIPNGSRVSVAGKENMNDLITLDPSTDESLAASIRETELAMNRLNLTDSLESEVNFSSEPIETTSTLPSSTEASIKSQKSSTNSSFTTMSPFSASTEGQSTNSSTGDEDDTTMLSRTQKELMIQRAITWFKTWLDAQLAVMITQCQGDSTESFSSIQISENERGSQSRGKKRQSREGDRGDESEGDSAEEEDKREKGRRDKRPKNDAFQKKFACPFYKHDRRLFRDWRVCTGPGWDTVHRVKEHIYRRHTPKFRCNRCLVDFKDSTNLATHQRMAVPCEIRELLFQPGFIDEKQEKKLRARSTRKKPGPSGSNQKTAEQERWIEMYRIVFPDDDIVPSPHYDDPEIEERPGAEEYAAFLRRELPRHFRRELDAVFEEELEERLRSHIIERIQAVQADLFRSFQECSGFGISEAEAPMETITESAGLQASESVESNTQWFHLSAGDEDSVPLNVDFDIFDTINPGDVFGSTLMGPVASQCQVEGVIDEPNSFERMLEDSGQ